MKSDFTTPKKQKISGKKVIPGHNDLATLNPQLAGEWNYEKNGELLPQNFALGSNKKVWWKCKKGHEWEATIYSRNAGRRCPVCFRKTHVSFPEKTLFFYIRRAFPEAAENYKVEWLGKRELDIYIPSRKVGIEYDGVWYHKDKDTRDAEKDRLCKEHGVTLIRIREKGASYAKSSAVVFNLPEDHRVSGAHLLPGLRFLEKYLGVDLDVDLSRDYDDIRNMIEKFDLENCVRKTNPELLDEWDYEKNERNGYTPDNVSAGAGVIIWWKCKRGHSYQTNISNKVHDSSGCPICSSHRLLPGFNDLATKNPQLASEWNYEKNGGLLPSDVMASTAKKVWWKCKRGHEWEATINSRSCGNGCPVCSNKKSLPGYNDLTITNPLLVDEWDYEKNGDLKPQDFLPNSGKKVWWKCNHGHEWITAIYNRSKGTSCPYCSGRMAIPGVNDLATTNPSLVREWDYEKNGDLKPQDFLPNSNKKVWWKCKKGHEWETIIYHRSGRGTGCPYCAGKKVLPGFNDLGTANPQLASEWNYEKNGELSPKDFTINSGKKVWWKCKRGHEWEATIDHRSNDTGCPYCAGKKVLPGFNDLGTANPQLASEWNYEKNGELSPKDFTINSGKKVWWKCKRGHEWEAILSNRNKGTGCPYCSGKMVALGFNDLKTKNPRLASEWNYEKNGSLKPTEVTTGSRKKVWWKCKKGHEWETEVQNRSAGNGCPVCAKEKRSKR